MVPPIRNKPPIRNTFAADGVVFRIGGFTVLNITELNRTKKCPKQHCVKNST